MCPFTSVRTVQLDRGGAGGRREEGGERGIVPPRQNLLNFEAEAH